uniref:Uncharacterized protein n=1 Tax=Arundo donax TaxID=35708 RepID=A0A0A9CFC7_ARUDO
MAEQGCCGVAGNLFAIAESSVPGSGLSVMLGEKTTL